MGDGMKKIPTLFQRDETRRYMTDVVTPGCEWVLAGEGRATRKFDGTCVLITRMVGEVAVMVRREVRPGAEAPPHFVEVDVDEVTGKQFGWEPYARSGFAKFILEALGVNGDDDYPDPECWPEGTYELCGPKINGNPERYDRHVLVKHGMEGAPLGTNARTYEELRTVLTGPAYDGYEGIVWHHPDGRMAKLKRRDFPKATT
jgi:hypothetical protein